MAIKRLLLWGPSLLVFFQVTKALVDTSVFPADFAWGAATAAYQVEGGVTEGGRGVSIWDTFSHTPGKTANGDNGDVADDSYHKYKEDIQLAKEMGLSHYRMSIAWSRILPTGGLPINPDGVAFYNSVINEVLAKNMTPFLTLYHWDLPQKLDDDTGGLGWVDDSIIDKFTTYCEVSFLAFGDRVKDWITFNEPLTFIQLGYGAGAHAPGRCSDRSKCDNGDSSTEPYLAAHNVLRSHAKCVAAYRKLKTTSPQILKGQIGITLNGDWGEPISDKAEDIEAANRYVEFQIGWFGDPVFLGHYPQSMVERVGDRLPTFSPEEVELLKGSYDYYGMNHYTSTYVGATPGWKKTDPSKKRGWFEDHGCALRSSKDGVPIGPLADSGWLLVVPWGFKNMLQWIAKRYDNPGIYVTENGVDVPNESALSLEEALKDDFRVDYYDGYISNMGIAMQNGVSVKGYFAWSLLDNFEWADGYSKRFGMHYVDYKDPSLPRYKKKSALWYRDLILESRKKAAEPEAKPDGTKPDGKPGDKGSPDQRVAQPGQGMESPQGPDLPNSNLRKRNDEVIRASVVSGFIGFGLALLLVGLLFGGRSLYRKRMQEGPVVSSPEEEDRESHEAHHELLNPQDRKQFFAGGANELKNRGTTGSAYGAGSGGLSNSRSSSQIIEMAPSEVMPRQPSQQMVGSKSLSQLPRVAFSDASMTKSVKADDAKYL